jgi:hypothetical protein
VVWGVAWSPDGKRILSGSDDWTAKIWDAATGAEIMTLGIPVPLIRDMIAEYLALAGDSAAKTGAFSGPSLYRAGPRETALQFGALVNKALAETRFLDPQNSAALRRGEALLQSLAGKGGVSRAELDTYYRQVIGTLIAETVDTEFRDVTVAASRKTAIKQALAAFYQNPSQTTYNGLKLYKYPVTAGDIAWTKEEMQRDLDNAEYFEQKGDKKLAESFRKGAEVSQKLVASYEVALAYINTIRVINDDLANRIYRESR